VLFSSATFLFYFLPVVLLLYFIVPRKWKNYILLLASLVFYFCGEPVYTVLLIFSSLSDYLHSRFIEKYRGTKIAKGLLISSIIINLGLLGFFKYADFFIENINALTGASIPLLRIALPIGISFYTFQTMSYTIDVYRGDVPAQRNLGTLATYVTLFPQLVAGPIVRYSTVEEELSNRTHSFENFAVGTRRLIIGLGKKVLIANVLGELVEVLAYTAAPSVLSAWVRAIALPIQIYFDFSGYSDMAIGIGRMFGFHFLENFNYPFISKSIAEFWRRWHISLGSWFRDYVYIPMGGNRVSKLKWLRNILVVWALTGFWHGANWNFMIWGLYFGVLLAGERMIWGKWVEKNRVVSYIYMIFLVLISFVIFNANNMSACFAHLSEMFGGTGDPFTNTEGLYYLRSYLVPIIIAIIGATPLPKRCVERITKSGTGAKVMSVLEPLFLLAVLVISVAFLIDGSFNPFLYFRF